MSHQILWSSWINEHSTRTSVTQSGPWGCSWARSPGADWRLLTKFSVVFCALDHILCIRRRWRRTLCTHCEAVQRDMRAPVVFAHKHIITSLGVQGNPECVIIYFIKCNGCKPLRCEYKAVHIEGPFSWGRSCREGGISQPILTPHGLWGDPIRLWVCPSGGVLEAGRDQGLASALLQGAEPWKYEPSRKVPWVCF